MSRRGNHEGSIYRREDGRFEGKVRLGGRRKSFYGKTEKEVRQQIRRAITDHERGVRPLSGQVTIEAFLTRWLEEVVRLTKEERTYEVYAYHVRDHILPTLGRLRLDRLEPDQVQRLYARLQQVGLSPKTVRNVHGVLSSALTQAVEWRLVGQNVASLAKRPRAVRRKEVRTLSPAEVRRLWDTANPRWKTLLLVTALTGARQGEILGLKWNDVDFARGTLTIQRQL
jgi:integrase